MNPWTSLHAKLHRSLRSRSLIPKGGRLLVAVSGGQDSICLIQLLRDLQPKWGWMLAIAHCDHRWRSDSAENAAFVANLAQTWRLPCHLESANSPPISEATARQWRYQVFETLAVTHRYSHVVTGHTASDRAETLLYNLIRGSGADGLQALTWQRPLSASHPEIQLVRPLLAVARAETGQFCQESHLSIWEDSTNQDLQYARNRIRQELTPYLQTYFNPQVEKNLAQTAEILAAEVDYLETAAAQLCVQALQFDGEDTPDSPTDPATLRLDRRILQSAPLALQRRVARQFLQHTLPHHPRFDQVEKLIALIPAPNRSRTDPFPGGAIAEVQGDWIVMTQKVG